MNETIEKFLAERKEKKRKEEKMKSEKDPEKIIAFENKFLLKNWLPNAAHRAGQLSFTSHPAKFSHPGIERENFYQFIADCKQENNGFLRSGNAGKIEIDVNGNAGALDVYAFLMLPMFDSQKTILTHLEEDTPEIRKALTVETEEYDEIRKKFLEIKDLKSEKKTDGRVKQVYFPCADGYHLLSILTPSGILFKMRKCIREIQDSKKAREDKKNERYNEKGYEAFKGLTLIGYGGSEPQNISTLNNDYHGKDPKLKKKTEVETLNNNYRGKAYLLPSLPPELIQKKIKLPTTDFYKNSLYFKQFSEEFEELDKLFKSDKNNKNIRNRIDDIYRDVIMIAILKVQRLREESLVRSDCEQFKRLPEIQKILLDDKYRNNRKETKDWFVNFKNSLSLWINQSYEKSIGKESVTMSVEDRQRIKNLIEEFEEELL